MYGSYYPGQSPFANLRTQLEQQLNELSEMEKQAAAQQQQMQQNPLYQVNMNFDQMVKNSVDNYILQLFPQQTQQPLAAPQQNPMQLIVAAIEEGLNKEDVDLLVNNNGQLPDFMKSKEGNKALQSFVNTFRKSIIPPEKNPD